MNVIVALDSAMGIFNNVPPRIHYCELDLQLPCHAEYFDLSGYAEMLQRSSFPRTRMKLIEAFRKLFVHPSELKAAYQNEILCCWDLLYLIHGMSGEFLAPVIRVLGLRLLTSTLSTIHALLATPGRRSAQ